MISRTSTTPRCDWGRGGIPSEGQVEDLDAEPACCFIIEPGSEPETLPLLLV